MYATKKAFLSHPSLSLSRLLCPLTQPFLLSLPVYFEMCFKLQVFTIVLLGVFFRSCSTAPEEFLDRPGRIVHGEAAQAGKRTNLGRRPGKSHGVFALSIIYPKFSKNLGFIFHVLKNCVTMQASLSIKLVWLLEHGAAWFSVGAHLSTQPAMWLLTRTFLRGLGSWLLDTVPGEGN